MKARLYSANSFSHLCFLLLFEQISKQKESGSSSSADGCGALASQKEGEGASSNLSRLQAHEQSHARVGREYVFQSVQNNPERFERLEVIRAYTDEDQRCCIRGCSNLADIWCGDIGDLPVCMEHFRVESTILADPKET